MRLAIVLSLIIFITTACNKTKETSSRVKGKLFIIGGGKRPAGLIDRMVQESGVKNGGYVIILPMASEEPDSAAWYAAQQFLERGIEKVYSFNFVSKQTDDSARLDSVKNARLIYIPGGDQNKFMAIAEGSPLFPALHLAYRNGATIAGTSAGAAVMSRKMITGNEKKYPQYTGDYRSIESDNIEIGSGLGFLSNSIVDQHFIKRMRMNRLIAVAIENPDNTLVGIDESTAILVQNDSAEVIGSNQVIVLNGNHSKKIQNGLLGAKNLNLSIFLPGEKFKLN